MTQKERFKRILAAFLSGILLAGLFPVGSSANDMSGDVLPIIDGETESSSRYDARKVKDLPSHAPLYDDTDVVRVSVILDGESTLDKGYEAETVTKNRAAVAYRDNLKKVQNELTERISTNILGGKKLDVVWNLTLVANLVSANVEYGKIDRIKAMSGVKDVILETQYLPAVYQREADSPNMSTAGTMVGAQAAWASNYTGAGSLIAIIDTGIDLEHQSFDASAFDDAIGELEAAGKTIDLLTADEVAETWQDLNASKLESTDGSLAYRSSKIPFAVNYVDQNMDVTHLGDREGEHGSHVAGIAAANRFIPDGNGGFVNALETVRTQGEAPDAQLIVMKVFGQGGGAYDSDYMAAVEDALMLGADVVNLSLGSSSTGFASNDEYASLLASLADSGVNANMIWSGSAGNNGSWADEAVTAGYLYSDDVGFATTGSPSTYANTLSVASVDNVGFTGEYLTVEEQMVLFNESEEYGNPPIIDTIGGQTLQYIYLDNVGVTMDGDDVDRDYFAELANEISLTGAVLMCNRGTSTFSVKANAAAAQGAAAVIIGNNQDGTIAMNLTDYQGNVPVVSISKADADMMKEVGTEQTSNSGIVYYVGELTVAESVGVNPSATSGQQMSDFSSWGVPGDLSMKPEITAPGGYIYSVFGTAKDQKGNLIGGSDKYENMSGTSMAAPQIAGLSAVFAQYIRENGLVAKTGLTQRQLTQSLFMSTAVPLVEEDSGNYYSVLKQGAGLVNIEKAMSTRTFITMDESATPSAFDGKVKVELGDDPNRVGEYEVTFTIHNMSDEEILYSLDGSFFTQDVFEEDGYSYRDLATTPIDAQLSWSSGNTVAVSAGSSTVVTASVTISNDVISNYDHCGAYIEGYLFVTESDSPDGEQGVKHSIPVLGYYGSWIEPSMYDRNNYIEQSYQIEDRLPYLCPVLGDTPVGGFLMKTEGSTTQEFLGGNPWGAGYDIDTSTGNPFYTPERNAINTETARISGVQYSQIRNSSAGRITLTDGGGILIYEKIIDGEEGAYYSTSKDEWMDTVKKTAIAPDLSSLTEGDTVVLTMTLASEYYGDKVSINWSELSEGATFTLPLTVDNSAPVFSSEPELNDGTLSFSLTDNQYIAGVYISDQNGNTIAEFGSDFEKTAGAAYNYDVLLEELGEGVDNTHFLVEVTDYAGNTLVRKLNLSGDDAGDDYTLTINTDELNLIVYTSAALSVTAEPWGRPDEVVWTSSNTDVATVNEYGVVTAVGKGETVITATSVSPLYPETTVTCLVTVEAFPFFGVLQDVEGDPVLFGWDPINEDTWSEYMPLDTGFTAAAFNSMGDHHLYLQDWDGIIHEVDSTDWTTIETSSDANQLGAPLEDMEFAYMYNSENGTRTAVGIYGGYFLYSDNIMDNSFAYGWNLASYLESYAGASSFVAIAWGGYDAESGVDMFYVLDDAGYIWGLNPDFAEGGLDLSLYGTDLNLSYAPLEKDKPMGNSMVLGDDGCVYLSHFNHDSNTTDFYALVYDPNYEYDEDSEEYYGGFNAIRIADAGEGIWPAYILTADLAGDGGQIFADEVKLNGKSISLSGDIGVNFKMTIPSQYVESSSMTFNVHGRAKTIDTANLTPNENGQYVFTCNVTSIEMAEPIHASFAYGDHTAEFDYSVADYVAAFESVSGEYSIETAELVHALADYGHHAQTFLSKYRNWTVGKDYAEMVGYDATYSAEEIAAVQAAVQDYALSYTTNADIEKVNIGLNLESETSIYVYLTPVRGYNGTVTCPDGYAIEKVGNRYRVTIPNVMAHRLGLTYDLTITTVSGTINVQASALSYLNSLLNNEAMGTEDENKYFAVAMYNYYEKAVSYLGTTMGFSRTISKGTPLAGASFEPSSLSGEVNRTVGKADQNLAEDYRPGKSITNTPLPVEYLAGK